MDIYISNTISATTAFHYYHMFAANICSVMFLFHHIVDVTLIDHHHPSCLLKVIFYLLDGKSSLNNHSGECVINLD